jgi:BirA family biotin operon repressor/biotin-[acetyl-CoA-carboxylase] ligase
MDDSSLIKCIRSETRFRRVIHVVSCDSTQALSTEDTEQDWAIFWADHQTAGRGRQGREWDDVAGQDLTVTFRLAGLVLPVPSRLAAVVPVAVLRAVESRVPETKIKWPNDLLLSGRKLCGVLIDSQGQPPDTHHVGIGINVNRTSFPGELAETGTSLALATGDLHERWEILVGIARSLDTVVSDLESDRLEGVSEAFRRHLDMMGQRVRISTGNRSIEGRVSQLDLDHFHLEEGERIALSHVQAVQRL